MESIIEWIGKIAVKYWPLYLNGAIGTLSMSALAVVAGSVAGILVAMLKMNKLGFHLLSFRNALQVEGEEHVIKPRGKFIRPFSLIATLYIEIIRGTPLMVQMYFFFYGLPMMFPSINTSADTAIIVALVLNSAGYMAEIIRAGIEAVDKGQTEAARSLGLSGRDTMLRIVLPQAIKNILPAMCNEFITIIKETAIVAVFFGRDIMTAVKTVQSITYRSIEPLVLAAMIYFVLTFLLSKIVAIFERRLKASD